MPSMKKLALYISLFLLLNSPLLVANQDYQLPDLSKQSDAVKDLLLEGYDRVKRHPDSAAVWGELGFMLSANSFEDDALIVLTQASDLEPGNPKWHAVIGTIHYNLTHDIKEVLRHLEMARNIAPKNVELLLFEGNILEEIGEYDRAYELYIEADTNIKPADKVVTNLALGRILMQLEKYPESKEYLLEAAGQLPASAEIRELLLKLSSYIKIDRKLIPDETVAINKAPVALQPPYYNNLAGKYNRDKEYLRYNFYRLFRLEQDISQAGRVMDLLYKYYPEVLSEAELLDYAFILSGRKKYQDAIRIYGEAISRFPDSAEAFLGRANLKFLARDFINAEKDYLDARNLKPKNNQILGRIYQGLGRIEATKKQFDNSIELLLKAIKLSPESAEVHLDLAKVYADNKRFSDAWRQLELAESKNLRINDSFKQRLKQAELQHKSNQ